MGNLINLSFSSGKQKTFVLVLGNHEQSWNKIRSKLDSPATNVVSSFYQFDQLPVLSGSGLLHDYSICLLVGVESLSHEQALQLKALVKTMPVILVKHTDNIYDISLEKHCNDKVAMNAFMSLDLAHYFRHCIGRFHGVQERFLKKAQPYGAICQSPVTDIDYCDVDMLLTGIVSSLESVARARGVRLSWLPTGQNLPVLLNLPSTRRYLMDLLLELFDYFTEVSLRVSPRSLMCDKSIWLELSAHKRRHLDNYRLNASEAVQGLSATLRESGGNLVVLDHEDSNLTLRLEWSLAFA